MTDVHQDCEAVWKAVTTGKPVRNVNDDRERDGSYVSGFRDITDTWTRQFGELVGKATLSQWRSFSLGSDQDGSRREIEIRRGDEMLFRAVQIGAIKTDRFIGADERYVGSRTTAGQQWQVEHGNHLLLPETLTRVDQRGAQ